MSAMMVLFLVPEPVTTVLAVTALCVWCLLRGKQNQEFAGNYLTY